MRRTFLFPVIALVLLTRSALVAQQPGGTPSGDPLKVVHVQGNVYLFSAAGVNTTVEIGEFGPLVVDTPSPSVMPQMLAEIRKLSSWPVRFLLHTTADPDYLSGDAALLASSRTLEAWIHNNLYNRLLAAPNGAVALPPSTITYSEPIVDTFNSEAVVIYQIPAAHTDADSVVFFRRSDVISTGPVYTPGRYPFIDVEKGGTINGLIDAVYRVLELAVPGNFASEGTVVIPGRGRLAEESDLGEYRNMLVIIKDRVAGMKNRGMTLQQIQASRPSVDYDTEYHATLADANRFIESIYRTLPQPQPPARQPTPKKGSRS
jgi:glyoxylase-like metal-dependent hydrolase (beta-lactamase superfamily II)